MSAIVAFNDLNLEISEYKDTWSLSDRQVAEGFGVTQEAVRKQRTQGATEYIEGACIIITKICITIAKVAYMIHPRTNRAGCLIVKKWYFGLAVSKL